MLWLYTVNLQLQNIARDRDERKGTSNDLISLTTVLLSFCLSTSQEQLGSALRIDIEIVVPELQSPLFIDTFD